MRLVALVGLALVASMTVACGGAENNSAGLDLGASASAQALVDEAAQQADSGDAAKNNAQLADESTAEMDSTPQYLREEYRGEVIRQCMEGNWFAAPDYIAALEVCKTAADPKWGSSEAKYLYVDIEGPPQQYRDYYAFFNKYYQPESIG